MILGTLSIASLFAVTGAVVGAALSSPTVVKGSSSSDVVVNSEKYDVITCCRYHKSNNTCDIGNTLIGPRGEWIQELTPQNYAKRNGYSTVHSIGFISRSSKCDLILMEVSK